MSQSRDFIGRRAEAFAAAFLRLKGYRVLAQRYRAPGGEIDIIARRGRMIAFIEVKRRPSAAEGLESVSPRQQKRVTRAAAHFLGRLADTKDMSWRFDILVMTPWRWPTHVLNAWSQSDHNAG